MNMQSKMQPVCVIILHITYNFWRSGRFSNPAVLVRRLFSKNHNNKNPWWTSKSYESEMETKKTWGLHQYTCYNDRFFGLIHNFVLYYTSRYIWVIFVHLLRPAMCWIRLLRRYMVHNRGHKCKFSCKMISNRIHIKHKISCLLLSPNMQNRKMFSSYMHLLFLQSSCPLGVSVSNGQDI